MKKPLHFVIFHFSVILLAAIICCLSVSSNAESTDESNFLLFNKRIRPFLAEYLNEKYEKKAALAKSESTTNMSVKMPVSKVKLLLQKIAQNFATPSMMDKCQQDISLNAINEDLAKFRDEPHTRFQFKTFHAEAFHELSKLNELNNALDVVQVSKLLLSVVIQMGYSVGSWAMKMENRELSRLLELYSCLEGIKNDEPTNVEFNIYVDAIFKHAEAELKQNDVLHIDFEPESVDKTARKEYFDLLKNFYGMNKSQGMSLPSTIELLEFLNKNEPFTIDVGIKAKIGEGMTMLMNAWSSIDSYKYNENGTIKGNTVFYLLKRFGRDLGRRLLGEEQMKQGYFQLFNGFKDMLKRLVKSMETSMLQYERNISMLEKPHLLYRQPMHFEELMKVEFKLSDVQLQNVTEARELVEEWVKALKEMTYGGHGRTIDQIKESRGKFNDPLFYKHCRFDCKVDTALNAFLKGVFPSAFLDKQTHLVNQAKLILVALKNLEMKTARFKNGGIISRLFDNMFR